MRLDFEIQLLFLVTLVGCTFLTWLFYSSYLTYSVC